MMAYDLIVGPADWIAGVWWNEVPPGKIGSLPDGGHRLCVARSAPANTATAPQYAKWFIEDGSRAVGGDVWLWSQHFRDGDLIGVIDSMRKRQRYFTDVLGCPGDGIEVCGDAWNFQYQLENGFSLPRWEHWHEAADHVATATGAPREDLWFRTGYGEGLAVFEGRKNEVQQPIARILNPVEYQRARSRGDLEELPNFFKPGRR